MELYNYLPEQAFMLTPAFHQDIDRKVVRGAKEVKRKEEKGGKEKKGQERKGNRIFGFQKSFY